MTTPTKAELAVAVKRLTEENAALRDLLAAVRETASAGEATRGSQWAHHPGHRAAQRISIWLEGSGGWKASRIREAAVNFREHAIDITGLGEPWETAEATPALEDAAAAGEDTAGDPFLGHGAPAPAVTP